MLYVYAAGFHELTSSTNDKKAQSYPHAVLQYISSLLKSYDISVWRFKTYIFGLFLTQIYFMTSEALLTTFLKLKTFGNVNFYCREKYSMNILLNSFFCALQMKESRTVLEQHESE